MTLYNIGLFKYLHRVYLLYNSNNYHLGPTVNLFFKLPTCRWYKIKIITLGLSTLNYKGRLRDLPKQVGLQKLGQAMVNNVQRCLCPGYRRRWDIQ